MQKVTVHPQGAPAPAADTPSAQLVRAAQQEATVTDACGRVITLRKPEFLAQFRLIEALGDTAKNDVYRAMCIPLLFVVAIDALPVPTPSNKPQIEALISRLGEDGFVAVRDGISEHFPSPDAAGQDEAVKNS
jgi:hypothetical protein